MGRIKAQTVVRPARASVCALHNSFLLIHGIYIHSEIKEKKICEKMALTDIRSDYKRAHKVEQKNTNQNFRGNRYYNERNTQNVRILQSEA